MENKLKKSLLLLVLMMVSVGAWAKMLTVSETLFEFDSNAAIEAWGYEAPTSLYSGTDLSHVVNFIKDGITVQANKGVGATNRFWYQSGRYELRIYDGGSIVITAPEDFNIISVEFVGDAVAFITEGYDNSTRIWTGEAASVTFNVKDLNTSIKVSHITVTVEEISADPTTSTITLNSACTDGNLVYGTYSNESAWEVPEDLTVSAITVSGETLTREEYATGDVVPANTGVLVSASAGGDYTVTLSSETGIAKIGNALRPTGAGITAETMASDDPGKEYFRLTMHNGTQCGFWWGAENGAAFSLGANKAYLVAVATSAGARGFTFGDNTEALETIEMPTATTIYTLNGVRVNELQKGLNIVNGKKVIK